MKRIKSDVVAKVIDVALRTDQMLSVVVATDDKDKPTHFVLVLLWDQIGKISVPGTTPATVWPDDFE